MDKSICAIVEYEYAAKEPDELDLHKGAIIHRIKQMPGGWWQGTLKASGLTGMFPDNFVRVLEPSSNGNLSGDDSAAVQLREKSATSNRRCKVIYSYTQVNDDELTLAVGDVIEFLGEVEEGWWRGRLRSKVGVFPSNFVQHIEPSPILASKRPPTIGATVATSALTAKAANLAATGAAATATTTGTTSATAATTAPPAASTAAVPATSKQTKNRTTASTTDAAAAAAAAVAANAAAAAVPTLPPKPQREYCRVEFPYAPQNDDELELKVDDIISIVSMELPDKGWWKGELRGKIGVFPDNFVKLLPPSDAPPVPPRPRPRSRIDDAARAAGGRGGPQRGGSFEFLGARMASFITTIFAPINETTTATTQQSQRKISNTSHMTTTNANSTSGSSSSTTVSQQQHQQQSSASTTSKVYIKKTGSSGNSASSSGRKESFGSRDSLNDILSETGLPIGTVAAQRKSLENKNLDLSKLPGKQQGNTIITTTTTSSSSSSSNTTNASTYADLRKSLDNMDEKIKSPPPPVLSKKPNVPLKKTPTGSVPSNVLSGGMKKKGSDSKLTSAVSHDVSDGLTGSKLLSAQLPESGAAGSVVMRRAATIAVEDTDFDRVERGSILQDMRAGRVKAPKRRPPSAAINVLGESNNNSVYVNGSGMASSASELSEDGGVGKQATASSDDNSTGEEPQLVKPKPREWEKKKAPWMEELKASQVTRKKTSPNVEPRGGAISVAERTSKLFATEQATATSSVLTTSATSSSTNSISTSATKVQSSAITSSSVQQFVSVESSSSQKKECTTSTSTSSNTSSSSTNIVTSNNNHNDAIMSKSSVTASKATGSVTTGAPATAAGASSDEELRATRPSTLSIRNRSVSPMVKTSNANASSSTTTTTVQEKSNNINNDSPATALQNNHQPAVSAAATTSAESAPRVQQLEGRVDKLEAMVLGQQRTIEELVRLLREETERVKVLRGELDKYAQCVTQV